MAEVAQEVNPVASVRKKFRIDFCTIEPGHRPDLQTDRSRGHHEVGALQRSVAKRKRGPEVAVRVALEHVPGVGFVRKHAGQMLMKLQIVCNERHDRCRHGLVHITSGQGRAQSLLGRGRTQEHETRRLRIHGGWRHFHEVEDLTQLRITHGLVKPSVLGACGSEKRLERVGIDHGRHKSGRGIRLQGAVAWTEAQRASTRRPRDARPANNDW